jgi:protein-S-isoprenylcysteine O-methyltransferase Ste14
MAALYALFAAISYAAFLAAFLYAVGFVGNLVVPKSIDAPAGAGGSLAFAIDVALLGLFALQHSVMARPAFKRVLTRVVPPAAERSVYVLVSSLLLAFVFWAWQPIADVAWDFRGTVVGEALAALYAAGWLLALFSTFMIRHFELFGLTQGWRRSRGRPMPQATFKEVLLYRVVRHPVMLGFMIAFWSVPLMTYGHLLFASLMTAYILIGVQLEEHDLLAAFGSSYARYRERVPMLVPFLKRPAHEPIARPSASLGQK